MHDRHRLVLLPFSSPCPVFAFCAYVRLVLSAKAVASVRFPLFAKRFGRGTETSGTCGTDGTGGPDMPATNLYSLYVKSPRRGPCIVCAMPATVERVVHIWNVNRLKRGQFRNWAKRLRVGFAPVRSRHTRRDASLGVRLAQTWRSTPSLGRFRPNFSCISGQRGLVRHTMLICRCVSVSEAADSAPRGVPPSLRPLLH